nr:hypothetical protein [Tanacetum cinerariifolium]
MNTTQAQQKALDDALVASTDHLRIEHDILSFIRDLAHSRDIINLTDVNVDYLHQPWREFATVINKCLSGKETGMDKIHLSRAQILWEKNPKPKYVRKKADSDTSPKQKPVQATKGVPDEQHLKTTSADEETGTIPGVPEVPIYESKGKKESWGDSGEEDEDDENDSVDKSDEQTEQEEEEYSDQRVYTPPDYELTDYEKINDEENVDDEERLDEEEEDEVEEDAHVTLTPVLETQKTDEPVQSSSVSSDFTSKLLNLENPSLADNEILMETSARHATTVPGITSCFTKTIPPPPSLFNPFLQHAIPTPTPTTSKATTSFSSLLDFSSVFREKAQAEKQEYIDNVDSTVRTIIREEVKTQLLKILPISVSAFATLVIERNVTESLEVAILARSSSQPKLTYEAAASLFKFELKKTILDKMEENNSHLIANDKKKLYDALVKSYNADRLLHGRLGVMGSSLAHSDP